jgi:hypothetical protein
MPSLRELQREFSGAVFGAGVPALLADQAAGFGIYRTNVLTNLSEALAAVYPVVKRVVGEEYFTRAARQYALRTPSASGDIHDYGAGFADYVRELPGAAELLYLPDLARLEWTLHRVFHAAERAPLDPERIRAVLASGGADFDVALHPACRVAAARYPVQHIWEAHQGPEDPPPLEIAPQVTFLLVARRGGDLVVETLRHEEFKVLHALQRGEAMDAALQDTVESDPDADLLSVLVRRLADGTLVERIES